MFVDDLPRNASGKLVRRNLADAMAPLTADAPGPARAAVVTHVAGDLRLGL